MVVCSQLGDHGSNQSRRTVNCRKIIQEPMHRIFQLDYFTLSTPTHWITVPDVSSETFTILDLSPSDTIQAVVRARNAQGLSPPSPLSKPMRTEPDVDGLDRDSLGDPRVVRERLGRRVLELTEATVMGSRKVKLVWEVRKECYTDNCF